MAKTAKKVKEKVKSPGRPLGGHLPRKAAPPLPVEEAIKEPERKAFYNECYALMKEKYGEGVKAYLPQLDLYVMATLKSRQLMGLVMSEGTVVQHTNRVGHTNNSENPRVRAFKMMNEQAMKLGKELGISSISKVRKTIVKDTAKRGFKLDAKV